MALKKKTTKVKTEKGKVAKSGLPFERLILRVPEDHFIRMVAKSGLPSDEARELVSAFKDLK